MIESKNLSFDNDLQKNIPRRFPLFYVPERRRKKKKKCDWKGRHTSPGVDGGSHLRPSGMEQEIWYPVQILNG